MAGSLRPNEWSRLRDDMDQMARHDAQSVAPYGYTVSFGRQNGCTPMFSDFAQCRAWPPGVDAADVNNALRFGEPFNTYEPGHSVSTELVGRSPFLARGEGMLAGIDTDSRLRSDMSNPGIVRKRKEVEETDLLGRKLPPLDAQVDVCDNLYRVVADNGDGIPRGGDPTRVIARNHEKYVRR